MKLIGLTGGIASGKSSVARVLRELGATVIDADQLAREVVAPGTPGWSEIRARWPQVIAPDGSLDRKALGKIVFSDPVARAGLNAITHPRIAEAGAQLADAARGRGEKVAYYEAALLVENGLADAFDGLVVVALPRELQLARLVARDGLTPAEAQARLGAQLPLAEKVARATRVIDNAGPPEATRAQVEAMHRALLEEA
jgi:dephospho-CoA kinase